MATKMGKQTRDVLEQLTRSRCIVRSNGGFGAPFTHNWDDEHKEIKFYGYSTYVWQPVFNGMIRRGWIEEVHRTPGDWVVYSISEQGRKVLAD